MCATRLVILTLASIGFIVGCKKDEVRVYDAPKNSESSGSATSEPTKAGSPPWRIPQGWQEKADAGGMRRGSYSVSAPDGRTADISIVALGSQSGSTLENINRWRGQLQLEPIAEEKIEAETQRVKIGPRDAALYEMVSVKPILENLYKARTLAAVLPAGDMTIFFKINGEDDLVRENKPKFLEFLRSVNTGEPNSTPNAPVSPSPALDSPKSSTSAPATLQNPVAPPPTTGIPKWEVPAGWEATEGSSMRIASFRVGSSGDMSVTALGPQAGGLLGNVNRWRGQISLNPLNPTDLSAQTSTLDLADGKATVIEMTGDRSPKGEPKRTQILAAIVVRPDRTWFYKLTGDDGIISKEKANFLKFVQSVRY